MGWLGLEPRTNTLKGYCSTIELPTRRLLKEEQKTMHEGARLRKEFLRIFHHPSDSSPHFQSFQDC